MTVTRNERIRNICIIAHVDHGKTTLVDHLLRQAGLFQSHEVLTERMMDSNTLERERGITIAAKNAAFAIGPTKVNLIDTPGHSDFSGEVERILSTVDGSILLVDAAEGPLPQTRFVLKKSLEQGHRIILCINKVDRKEVQGDNFKSLHKVVDQVFSLFLELGATEEQSEFPILYACARKGWCTPDLDEVTALLNEEKAGTLKPMFDLIHDYLPPPSIVDGEPLRLLFSNISWSDYLGQLGVGKIFAGKLEKNQTVYHHTLDENGKPISKRTVLPKIFVYAGMKQVEVDTIEAGDIAAVSGCQSILIGDSLTATQDQPPMQRIKVEAPTMRMIFSINTSPLSGMEGEAIQARKLRDRLLQECKVNVAMQFQETETTEQFYLLGRGELQFSVLVEQMRREGLEFMIGRPTILLRENEKGEKEEPVETVYIDMPSETSGAVTELMQLRKGMLESYDNLSETRVRLQFLIPSRRFFGVRSHVLTITKGEGILSSEVTGYVPYQGAMFSRANGSLISDRSGKTTAYALANLEERGKLFIRPSVEVYEGMVIGECSRDNDMNVNPVRGKQLTNVRSVSSDGITILAGVRDMSLEEYIEWIDDDEWIECTPKSIRVRKRELTGAKRSVIRNKK